MSASAPSNVLVAWESAVRRWFNARQDSSEQRRNLWQWLTRRREVDEIGLLTPRELRDIGLDRYDLAGRWAGRG